MNAPTPHSLERHVAEADAAFANGRLHAASAALARMDFAAARAAGLGRRLDFLLFALACYHLGAPAEALARHRAAGPQLFPALRYRMLVETARLAEAARFRKTAAFSATVRADFAWTLSRSALWSGRLGRGLSLYAARARAQNFARVLPKWLRHDPSAADAEAPPVALEQGLGDVLFHVGQMKAMSVRPGRVFGPARHRNLINALWPGAPFHDFGDGAGEQKGAKVALAGDWMLRRLLRDGGLGPLQPLISRDPHAARSGIGICWRAGSGQNRRDEREIPLQFFLDLLPQGPGYVALQHDLSSDELAMLRARPDIAPPDLDLRRDDLALAHAIGGLAGVITVDSANAHLAGAVGTPLLLLMNPRAHWYWGPAAEAGHIYPGAETMGMEALSAPVIAKWIDRRRAKPPAKARAQGPLFITGAPRSRTSMIAGALAQGGLRLGQTIGPTADNRTGFAENRAIRETVLKPLLSASGFDPQGVRALPPPDWAPPAPGLRSALTDALGGEGLWGYKDPKLLLLWRRWAAAFPEATWLIVERPADLVVASYLRTGFMRRHSDSPHYWRHFLRSYHMRAEALRGALGDRVITVEAEAVAADHAFPEPVRSRLSALGLDMDAAAAFLTRSAA